MANTKITQIRKRRPDLFENNHFLGNATIPNKLEMIVSFSQFGLKGIASVFAVSLNKKSPNNQDIADAIYNEFGVNRVTVLFEGEQILSPSIFHS